MTKLVSASPWVLIFRGRGQSQRSADSREPVRVPKARVRAQALMQTLALALAQTLEQTQTLVQVQARMAPPPQAMPPAPRPLPQVLLVAPASGRLPAVPIQPVRPSHRVNAREDRPATSLAPQRPAYHRRPPVRPPERREAKVQTAPPAPGPPRYLGAYRRGQDQGRPAHRMSHPGSRHLRSPDLLASSDRTARVGLHRGRARWRARSPG